MLPVHVRANGQSWEGGQRYRLRGLIERACYWRAWHRCDADRLRRLVCPGNGNGTRYRLRYRRPIGFDSGCIAALHINAASGIDGKRAKQAAAINTANLVSDNRSSCTRRTASSQRNV